MIFKRTERKRRSAPVILTVGALAAIGAVSITRRGKEMLTSAAEKVKGFFSKSGTSQGEDN